jgi:hypothetical protein
MAADCGNMLNKVLVLGRHSDNSFASAALSRIGIGIKSLYIAGVAHCNYTGVAVYHILEDDLFERVRISMPADKPVSLEKQEVADALAFILQKNSAPSGSTELPTDGEALKAIKVLAKKP